MCARARVGGWVGGWVGVGVGVSVGVGVGVGVCVCVRVCVCVARHLGCGLLDHLAPRPLQRDPEVRVRRAPPPRQLPRPRSRPLVRSEHFPRRRADRPRSVTEGDSGGAPRRSWARPPKWPAGTGSTRASGLEGGSTGRHPWMRRAGRGSGRGVADRAPARRVMGGCGIRCEARDAGFAGRVS